MADLDRPDGPLTDRALAGLRCAAVLLVGVPGVRARVRHRGAVLLEVRRGCGDDDGDVVDAHPVLPPCAFHRAVAAAHRHRRAGEQVALRGVTAGEDPVIEVGVGRGDVLLPGAIVRVDVGGAWLHAVAVAVPLLECTIGVLGDDGGPPGLGFHGDEELEATLMHLTTPRGDHVASAEVVDALQLALGRTAVRELLDRLDAVAPDTPAALVGPAAS